MLYFPFFKSTEVHPFDIVNFQTNLRNELCEFNNSTRDVSVAATDSDLVAGIPTIKSALSNIYTLASLFGKGYSLCKLNCGAIPLLSAQHYLWQAACNASAATRHLSSRGMKTIGPTVV